MGKSITFIDWDDVSYTITRVANLTGGTARDIEGAWKVSNIIWVIFSRLAFGLRGASVRRIGDSSDCIIIRLRTVSKGYEVRPATAVTLCAIIQLTNMWVFLGSGSIPLAVS